MPTTELAPAPSDVIRRCVRGGPRDGVAPPAELSGDDTKSTVFAWLISRALTLTSWCRSSRPSSAM